MAASAAAAEIGVSSEALGVAEADRGSCPPATLLLVVGEPFTIDHKDLILERIVTELLAWDSELAKCDIDEQLGAFARQQPKAHNGPNGEKIFSLESGQLRVTVLLNARVQTVREQIRSFLLTRSAYRHLLYSGLALHGSGYWILQDGIFGFSSLSELFRQPDVANALGRTEGGTLDVGVISEGSEWKEENLRHLAPNINIRLNPPKSQKNEDGVVQFTDILSISLKAPSSVELLPATDDVGNLSFKRPTLYVFPAGSGDSAFFGVSGFNLLVNGGYSRRSCFWQLVRHLIRIDAVFVSHIGPENIFGISSFFERKAVERTSPDLGMVYLNIGDTKSVAPNGALPVSTGLIVSLADEGASIVDHLNHIGMSVHPCLGSLTGQTLQSFNLYFNIGHGSLDLYILNPLNGKELKDFLENWARDINCVKLNGVPLSDEQSICSLLVWKPACPKEKTVRILFPGNTPQSKIFAGIEKLRSVALFQSATGVAEKAEGKPSDKKPPSGVGKPSSGRQTAPPSAAEAEHVKPSGAALEQRTLATENKDLRKSKEHRETRRPADNKTAGKVKLESKGKAEHKEQKPAGKSTQPAKRNEGKSGTERKESKAPGKPETDTRKAELKADHKETKSLAKQELEAKKGEEKHLTEPREGKKVPRTEQKDSKRVSTATRSAAAAAVVETKESKAPASEQELPPSKVSSKVTEKSAKDAKNKKVVMETKTQTKKETAAKDSATPTTSPGKEQKETAVEAKGHLMEKPLPPVPVEVGKTQADSVEAEKTSKEEERIKTETKESSSSAPDEKIDMNKNLGTEKFDQLPETSAASVATEEMHNRQVEAEHLTLSPEIKAELESALDQPEPAVADVDRVVAMEESTLTTDPAALEEEPVSQTVSPSEKTPPSTVPKTEAEDETVSVLSKSAHVEDPEPVVDHSASEEVVEHPLVVEVHPDTKETIKEPEFLPGEPAAEEIVERPAVVEVYPANKETIKEPEFLPVEPAAEEVVEHPPVVEVHPDTNETIKEPDLLPGDPAAEEVIEKPLELVDHPVQEEAVKEYEPILGHLTSGEAAEKLEQLVDLPAPGDKVTEEPFVLDLPLATEEISEKDVHVPSVEPPHSLDVSESVQSAEKIESLETEPSVLIGDQSAVTVEEPFGDDLIDPDDQLIEDQISLTEKDLLEMLEKEATHMANVVLLDKSESERAERQRSESDELEKGIPAKVSEADSHSAAIEKDFPEAPETEEHRETEKHLLDVQQGPGSVDSPRSGQQEGENASVEAAAGHLAEKEEHLPSEEEGFVGDDKSHGDVNLLDREEPPFDPRASWGQPEGLPAPLHGKKDGGGKRGNQPSMSSSKKPASQNVSGKKTDGKDGTSSTKRPSAAAENPARVEKLEDEGPKLSTSRSGTATGTQKKGQPPSHTTEASFRESSAKMTHSSDVRKTAPKSVVPFYVDLAYVPCHGDTHRFDVDFFRVVVARYYVISSSEPDPRVLNLLLAAKESWTTYTEETVIIPTYDSDELTAWVAENRERLDRLKVVVALSANRHTLQLQEHEANCQAYRLEF